MPNDAYLYTLMGTPIVHDGDTVTVTVDLGFELYHVLHMRLAGINAPELVTDEGKQSRAALLGEVNGQSPLGWSAQTFKSGHENYGRWLATFGQRLGGGHEWMNISAHLSPSHKLRLKSALCADIAGNATLAATAGSNKTGRTDGDGVAYGERTTDDRQGRVTSTDHDWHPIRPNQLSTRIKTRQ